MTRTRLDCPRCGYDQSGVLRSDLDAWPLASRCTECGLEIAWGRYFSSDATLPRRWIEHCEWPRIPVAWVLTLLVAAFGWPLFHRLRLEHPIRSARLLATVIWTAALAFAAIVGPVAWDAYGSISRQTARTNSVRAMSMAQQPSGPRFFWILVPAEPVSFFEVWRAIVLVLVQPSSYDDVPVYSHALVSDPEAVASAQEAWLSEGRVAANPGLVRARLPLHGVGVSPIQHWTAGRPELRSVLRFTLSASIAALLAFAFLPIARKRAKVRAAQLLRCGAYFAIGGLPFLLVLTLEQRRFAVPPLWSSNGLFFGGARDLLVVIPVVIFLGAWWRLASGPYLRMSRPTAVAASVATIGALTAYAIELL